MVRIMVLALILLVAAATPTAAAGADSGGAPAIRQSLSPAPAVPPAEGQAASGVALLEPVLRIRGFAGPGQVVDRSRGLMPERRRQQPVILPWRSQGRSALALPLTDRLALGVGYRRVLGEDLWREFAEIGGMDYESHNVLLRAHWRF
jgi:hypothetical protein